MPSSSPPLTTEPQIMGIVNLNDDSFSGDGSLSVGQEIEKSIQFCRDGADFIDLGAESARTNREAISIEEEIGRLVPFLEQFPAALDAAGLSNPLISINSWRPEVLAALMPYGIDLINDIGGLPDGDFRNAELAVEYHSSLLIMHTVGLPKVAHTHQVWDQVLDSIEAFFEEKVRGCETLGLPREQIVLDPGIDFAKQRDDNLRIYRDLARFKERFGCRILLPVSRKTVIGDVLDLPDPKDRDAGTVACITRGLTQGADIFRVHHVKAAQQAVQMIRALSR